MSDTSNQVAEILMSCMSRATKSDMKETSDVAYSITFWFVTFNQCKHKNVFYLFTLCVLLFHTAAFFSVFI